MGSKSESELFKEHFHFLTFEGGAFTVPCAWPLVPRGCIGLYRTQILIQISSLPQGFEKESRVNFNRW